MSEPNSGGSVDSHAPIDRLCERLKQAIEQGLPGPIEALLEEAPGGLRDRALEELVAVDAQLRAMRGEQPRWEDYAPRFADRLGAAWKGFRHNDSAVKKPPELVDSTVDQGDTADHVPGDEELDDPDPAQLGPYQVVTLLGEGTFGRVFQATHPQRGVVAIKVLKRRWAAVPACREVFLREARTTTQFDHPGLVRVYELCAEAEPPYFVQEFVDGGTLAERLGQASKPSLEETLEIVIQIADALAHIHSFGKYHRDLKPANVLLDRKGRVRVADFGLALDQADRWSQPQGPVGTYYFMPPEQLRGSPLLNAQCDLWSLGVIFYRLLTGALPFQRSSREELCEEIFCRSPDAPVVFDQSIPRSVNRLCMQCLEKQEKLRPESASLLRDDLQQELARLRGGPSTGEKTSEPQTVVEYPQPTLRRFTAELAEMYLRLMPKSYGNQEELPELIAYWKQRISKTDTDETFRVGVLVGVSGCGKSSLLEAGLLPSLPDPTHAVLIEASESDTEVRVIKKLRKLLPEAEPEGQSWSLPQWTQRLRQGADLPAGHKVLLVLDQFEQWLHAHGGNPNSQLLEALEQCDGEHLQAIVCVREGFHSSLIQFVHVLGIGLDEDENYATASRFRPDHARFVLEQFGRGVGRLQRELSAEQRAFLDAAVEGLAEPDRGVVCVRLVALALVMQDREWTVEELDKLGGLDGIGRQFLHDQLEGRNSSELLRRSVPATIRVLESLLPAEGLEIKDSRSYFELLQASDLPQHDFDQLLNHFVRRLFLITPVDTDAGPSTSEETPEAVPQERRAYQLTHDFLVPSVRQWIHWKEEQTPEGRARLKLRQLSGAWQADEHHKRHLPSLQEFFQIRRRTDRGRWSDTQTALMKAAGWFYAKWTGVISAAVVIVCLLIYAGYYEAQASRLGSSLLSADVSRVTEFRGEIAPFAWRADTKLRQAINKENADEDPLRTLHARIGLAPRDAEQHEPLRQSLLDAELPWEYLQVIGDALTEAHVDFTSSMWEVMRNASQPDTIRFRAGLVLSKYQPLVSGEGESPWSEPDGEYLIAQYLATNPEFHGVIRQYLTPNSLLLNPPLAKAFHGEQLTVVQREAAAKALVDFFPASAAKADFDQLLPLLLLGTSEQYQILYPLVRDTAALDQDMVALVRTLPAETLGTAKRAAYGKQRATAAITLLRKGWKRAELLDVLKVTDDPEAMTQFIHRCQARGVTADELLELWDLPEVPKLLQRHALPVADRQALDSQLFGLLLSLGEYSWSQIPDDRQVGLRDQVADLFRDDKSSGVHSAAGWLLRAWGGESTELAELAQTLDERVVPRRDGWEWYTDVLEVETKGLLGDPLPWSYYQTYVLFEEGDYDFGSPSDEPDHGSDEVMHTRRLAGFAVLDRELTRGEVEASKLIKFRGYESKSTTLAHAMVGPNWYDAVRVSRWLSDQLGYGESQAYRAESDLPESEYERDKADGQGGVYNWPVDLSARGFRLPTEHEWEASCRVGMRTMYSFGSDPELLPSYGWFQENSGRQAHPPRQQRPNLRGLFDVHGNALEWCHDWNGQYAAEGEASWPSEGAPRVLRGGSWGSTPLSCRSAGRSGYAPTNRVTRLGLRVLRSSVQSSQE